jgi:hypothetical protein
MRKYVLSVLLILMLGYFSQYLFAQKAGKTYGEEGKITATGLTEWVINRQHQYAHTYTVVSAGKAYVLECGHKPVFGSMGEECGGAKKLQIGDVIHFRLENDRAYIPIKKTDNTPGEEKLRILSTQLSPDAAPDKTEAAPQKQ